MSAIESSQATTKVPYCEAAARYNAIMIESNDLKAGIYDMSHGPDGNIGYLSRIILDEFDVESDAMFDAACATVLAETGWSYDDISVEVQRRARMTQVYETAQS